MRLVGDIGGTKALLALFDEAGAVFERRYACAGFGSFAQMLERFRADARAAMGAEPEVGSASLGVAGPVSSGRVRLTNLDWVIDARELGLPRVRLLNDFEACAHGLAGLRPEKDLATLQAGSPRATAPRLLIGAGTGLGVAFAVGRGRSVRVLAGEGGHFAFAPADELQDALLRHLRASLGRVELEHVVSGAGLERIYAFLRDTGRQAESPATRQAIAKGDAPAAIAQAADEGDALSSAALDLFIACYGAAAGDHALAVLARGGVFVAGGIAPKVLPRLRGGGFLAAFNAKGDFSASARACPVHVVTNERLGLLGAAAAAPA